MCRSMDGKQLAMSAWSTQAGRVHPAVILRAASSAHLHAAPVPRFGMHAKVLAIHCGSNRCRSAW